MLNSEQAFIMLAEVRTLTEGFPVNTHTGRFSVVLAKEREKKVSFLVVSSRNRLKNLLIIQ